MHANQDRIFAAVTKFAKAVQENDDSTHESVEYAKDEEEDDDTTHESVDLSEVLDSYADRCNRSQSRKAR